MLYFALRNSVGNIVDILRALNKDTHTKEELQANYLALIEKWGEWEIIGEGMSGLVIRYVDVGNALFSGLAIIFTTLSVVFLVTGIVLGKIVFPLLSKHYKNTNDELVDVSTLRTAEQMKILVQEKGQTKAKTKQTQSGGDWF